MDINVLLLPYEYVPKREVLKIFRAISIYIFGNILKISKLFHLQRYFEDFKILTSSEIF